MSLKVMVNSFACDGHRLCVGLAPSMFKVGTDNKAYAAANTVPEADEALVRRAARACPMRAIMTLEDA